MQVVGWVERSDTYQLMAVLAMGIAALHPSYRATELPINLMHLLSQALGADH